MFDSHPCSAYTNDYLRALRGLSFKDRTNIHIVISDKKGIVTETKYCPVRSERCTELHATSKRKVSVTDIKEYIDQVYQTISRPFRYKVYTLKSVHLVYMTVLLQ